MPKITEKTTSTCRYCGKTFLHSVNRPTENCKNTKCRQLAAIIRYNKKPFPTFNISKKNTNQHKNYADVLYHGCIA